MSFVGNAFSSSGEKEDPRLTPDGKSTPSCCSGGFGEFWGFWDSLLLGEDRPREAVGGGGVNELQHLLVTILGVDENRQDRPENLLQPKKNPHKPSGSAPKSPGSPKKPIETVRIGPKISWEPQKQRGLGQKPPVQPK